MNKTITLMLGAVAVLSLVGCSADNRPEGNARLLCPLAGAAVGGLAGGGGAVAGFAAGAVICDYSRYGEDATAKTDEPMMSDQDGDGVSDDIDRCANTPAGTTVDAKGCPVASAIMIPANCQDYVQLSADESEIVGFEPVHFALDKSTLDMSAKEKLSCYATLAKDHDLALNLSGYTDSQGPKAYNQRLSERRVLSVNSYLMQQGMTQEQLSTKAEGQMDPVAPNDNPQGRQQNRRVEFNIVK